jgi:AGCS family alanine or glycine:cation symporter
MLIRREIMEFFMELNSQLNSLVWGPYMLVLIVGTGVYLTTRTNFMSITKIGYVLKNTLLKMFEKTTVGEGEITPFQAVATALAATIGIGNIAGVATAIALGALGPYSGCGCRRYSGWPQNTEKLC